MDNSFNNLFNTADYSQLQQHDYIDNDNTLDFMRMASGNLHLQKAGLLDETYL